MNINLAGGSKKKQQQAGKTIGFGLNKRKKKPANAFDDSDDDDDDAEQESATNNNEDRRDAVNREIAAEQEALRKRAKKAMAGAGSDKDSLYDYDGAYDSFQPKVDKSKQEEDDDKPKESRYIHDLLKQSEKRNVEREAIYERKVAREQEEEDAQADYRGKEKFVTKAYKRKLEERKQLAAADRTQQEEEDKHDVTKQTGGAAFANFYGNMNRNVAMGGGEKVSSKSSTKDEGGGDKEKGKQSLKEKLAAELGGFMDEFETGASGGDSGGNNNGDSEQATAASTEQQTEEVVEKPAPIDPAVQRLAIRKAREEKVAQARIRYFQRNDMPLDSIATS